MRPTLKIQTKRGAWHISPVWINVTWDDRVYAHVPIREIGETTMDYEAFFFRKNEFNGNQIEGKAIPTWIRRQASLYIKGLLRKSQGSTR